MSNFDDLPVMATFVGYPPLPGESSGEYRHRVKATVWADIMRPEPTLEPTLWQRLKVYFTGVSPEQPIAPSGEER